MIQGLVVFCPCIILRTCCIHETQRNARIDWISILAFVALHLTNHITLFSTRSWPKMDEARDKKKVPREYAVFPACSKYLLVCIREIRWWAEMYLNAVMVQFYFMHNADSLSSKSLLLCAMLLLLWSVSLTFVVLDKHEIDFHSYKVTTYSNMKITEVEFQNAYGFTVN